jgi:hypothetical protein
MGVSGEMSRIGMTSVCMQIAHQIYRGLANDTCSFIGEKYSLIIRAFGPSRAIQIGMLEKLLLTLKNVPISY